MARGIGDNLTASFEFAKDGLVGHWLRWLILILVTCIPFVNFITSFITSGYLVKIYKGGDIAPELEGYLDMWIDGIKLAIIAIVYTIIPIIMIIAGAVFTGFGGLALLAGAAEAAGGEATDAFAGVAIGTASSMTGVLLILIGIVLFIILCLIATIAGIRFAKTERLGEGFNFEEIFATIKEIGWVHYILSYILFIVVIFVIIFVLSLIPLLGTLLLLIITPLLMMWQGKFFENLYSRA
jgi:hypothetical protein